MFKRNIKGRLESALSKKPSVLLVGARQIGKSTLVKEIARERDLPYITFDNVRSRTLALEDPTGYLAGQSKPIVLDEVQKAPILFDAIKEDIDLNRTPGRYLLTGSTDPMFIPGTTNSLVGRVGLLTMHPLSQGELVGNFERFLDSLFEPDFTYQQSSGISRADLIEKIIFGGYPDVQGKSRADRAEWFGDYETTMLSREILDVSQVDWLAALPRLLELLASRGSQLLNVAELARGSLIPGTTLHRYLALLKSLFLIDFLNPWLPNRGKRLMKAPKLLFLDTGFLTFLLKTEHERLQDDRVLLGFVFENFVINEIIKQASWNETRANFYHFRTAVGVEVDLVIESAQGKIVGLEVKSSDSVTASDFNNLKALAELAGPQWQGGFIIYTGKEVVKAGKNLLALPVTAIWETTLT